MSIRVRNWRDQAPYVGHISALVWTLYQSHDKDETSPPDVNRLHGINSFVKHGLQGHQHSDHHRHDSIEQLYFILRGRGQLLIGDDKVDVRDGTAVYMPVNVPHQAFNDGDGWMEHLIVSCPLDEIREGTPAVRDWRDVHPVVLEGGTVSWPLLLREEEAPASEGGVLQRVQSVTRYAVQGRQGTAWQQLDGIELVHYVLSGYGTIEDLEGKPQLVTEGSAAHVLPGVAHRLANQGEGWLEYVTFAVEVGDVEMPRESEEEAESEEPSGQYEVEEVAAAAVVAEAGLDDADAVEADAVETEEEIEEAPDADAVEEEIEEASDGDGVDEAADGGEAEDTDVDELDGEAGEVADEAEDDSAEVEEEAEVTEDAESEEEVEEAEDDSDEVEAEAEEVEAQESETEAADSDEDEDVEEEGSGDADGDEEAPDADAVEEEDEEASGEPEGEDVEDAAEEEPEVEAQEEELSADEDEAEVESAEEADAEDDSFADEDDFDLDDDDADFDIEDEDETAEEDETGHDDFPDPDRR